MSIYVKKMFDVYERCKIYYNKNVPSYYNNIEKNIVYLKYNYKKKVTDSIYISSLDDFIHFVYLLIRTEMDIILRVSVGCGIMCPDIPEKTDILIDDETDIQYECGSAVRGYFIEVDRDMFREFIKCADSFLDNYRHMSISEEHVIENRHDIYRIMHDWIINGEKNDDTIYKYFEDSQLNPFEMIMHDMSIKTGLSFFDFISKYEHIDRFMYLSEKDTFSQIKSIDLMYNTECPICYDKKWVAGHHGHVMCCGDCFLRLFFNSFANTRCVMCRSFIFY